MVNDTNHFKWRGYDLRKIPDGDAFDYGMLPPGFLDEILPPCGIPKRRAWVSTSVHGKSPSEAARLCMVPVPLRLPNKFLGPDHLPTFMSACALPGSGRPVFYPGERPDL
jgi:hypothetical protein